MKVYLQPDVYSRGLLRVADALVQYAPSWVQLVQRPEDSDFEILHVIGRHDSIEKRVEIFERKKKPFAMIQYCVRSTMRAHTAEWIDLWQKAKLVWSYYDLPELCREDGLGESLPNGSYTMPGFNFYYSPLGVDSNIFKDTKAFCLWCGDSYNNHEDSRPANAPVPRTPCLLLKSGFVSKRQFIIAACSQHALSEGARECAFASKRVGKTMFFLGHELRRGEDIICRTGMTDEVLAGYYSQCKFVSGLRRTEGFEFPVIEGALCGARPIVFDKPHYRKWYGDFAIFIPEGNRESVIDNLESIFNQGIPEVSEEEKKIIRKRFDWEPIIKNFWNKII